METRTFGERIAACKREIRARADRGVERRTFPTTLEARATAAGWRVAGHGIVYNSLSENLGGFREQIAPGAADKVLAKAPDIRGLFNHNPDLILGRTRAGTMTVEDDPPVGVRYVIDAPATSYADNLRVSLERGDVTQSSFAFTVARGGESWDEDPETGGLIRTITEFSGLFDMSPVTYAAYEATDSGTASHDAAEAETDDLEGDEPEGDTEAREGSDDDTAPDGERHDDEAASQRVEDGPDEERQADEPVEQGEPWRLAAVKRHMALRERA